MGSNHPQIMVGTAQTNTEKCFVTTFKCYPLLYSDCDKHCLVGEAPSFTVLPMTHQELKGQGSALLSQASNKHAGDLVSHPSLGTWWGRFALGFVRCSVIVSLSPTPDRRQQQADKQIEQLFDARSLFLCDMLTPFLLCSYGGNMTRRFACSDSEE